MIYKFKLQKHDKLSVSEGIVNYRFDLIEKIKFIKILNWICEKNRLLCLKDKLWAIPIIILGKFCKNFSLFNFIWLIDKCKWINSIDELIYLDLSNI
jgi:hypothetical protein